MELHDDLQEELECGVCMELYKEPKTLPCIHTFCRECITRHIVSQRQQHEKLKGFICPLCRFYVRVPRPDRPLEQWAHQLPNNTSIPRLTDALLRQLNNRFRCNYHPEELFSSYCKVCNCLACTKCLGERHPTCTGDSFCSVKEIALKKKLQLLSGLTSLDSEQRRIIENVDLVKTVVSGLKDAKSRLLEDIQDHAQVAVQNITKEEAELIDQLDQAVEEQLKGVKLTKNPVDEAADILRHYKEEIDGLMKSSTGLTYMDNLELARERHKECLEMIQRLSSQCRPPSITFVERESNKPSMGTLVSPSLSENFLAGDPGDVATSSDQSGLPEASASAATSQHKTYL